MKPRANHDANESARYANKYTATPDLLVLDFAPTHEVPVRAHQRTVSGPDTPSGQQRKEAALMALEGKRSTKAALDYVRQELRNLYESRVRALTDASQMAGVTADDADRILRDWPMCPDEAKESHAPQMWRGSIFRQGWRKTGRSKPSIRKRLNGTDLPIWRPL